MTIDQNNDATTWWEETTSRRDASKVGLGVAAVAGLAGVTTACGSGEKTVNMDTLDAQKKGGWNVGDNNLKLTFTNVMATDSLDGSSAAYLDPKKLMSVTSADGAWKKYEMPTLFQALEQKTLVPQMKMYATMQMKEAYNQAHGLASLLNSVEKPNETMLIIDAKGPVSVAAAAGMAESVQPIFWFDNWPHPKGVTKAHTTLGATLFFASELEKAKAKRDNAKAPVAFVLDANRLNPYTSETTQFDNRYGVTLPSGEDLKKQGIKSILYVTAQEKKTELDDINDYAVEYEKAGIKLEMLALTAFKKDPSYKEDPKEKDPSRGYYYGGNRSSHTHFFVYYPMYVYRPMYGRYPAPSASRAPASVRKPAYKASARKTAFSGRKTGGASGVGRRKPTGMGRVSTRVNKSGGIVGTKSGSYGRFRSSSGGG